MELTKLVAALSSCMLIMASGAVSAQTRAKPPQPTPAANPRPSGADIVNKMLSPGPSDPSVPLPRADLAGETAEAASSKSPRIYGRGEEGGVVFGLRVPIPADRNESSADTRYSSGRLDLAEPQELR